MQSSTWSSTVAMLSDWSSAFSKVEPFTKRFLKGDRQTLKDINKFVRELYHQKDEENSVYDLQAASDEDIILVGWADAALANRDLLERGVAGPVSLASWSTHKLRRICRSSLAAEAQAMSECEAELFINRILAGATWKGRGSFQTSYDSSFDHCSPDYRRQGSLRHVAAEGHPADELQRETYCIRSARIDAALDGTRNRPSLVQQHQQLSDGLTKVGAQERIAKFMNNGQRWGLVFDEKFTAAKKLRAAKPAVVNFSTNEGPTWLDVLSRTSGHVESSAFGISRSPQHINRLTVTDNMSAQGSLRP